jgi:hypothetical protein
MSRSDNKHLALLALTASTDGAIDDLEWLWLQAKVLAPAGLQINDLYMQMFKEGGAVSDEFNTAAYEWLVIQGVTPGALPDMWDIWWVSQIP